MFSKIENGYVIMPNNIWAKNMKFKKMISPMREENSRPIIMYAVLYPFSHEGCT